MKKVSTTVLASVLLAAQFGVAQVSNIQLDEYQKYLGRKGLEVHARGTGNLLFSRAADQNALIPLLQQGQEKAEKLQTTWFDLDMKYRPKDWLSARIILRLHQDWQTYFMARSRPLSFLWASADGKKTFGNGFGFSYSVGDFQEKYNPLTVWAPELNLMAEPKIFAREHQETQADYFVGDNQRTLQGGKLNSVYRLSEGNELQFNTLFSQIKRAQYLDKSGKDGSENTWNDGLNGDFTDFDAYAYALNANILALNGLYIGGGTVRSWEDPASFNPDSRIFAVNDTAYAGHLMNLKKYTGATKEALQAKYFAHVDSLNYRFSMNNPLDVQVINTQGGFDWNSFNKQSSLIAKVEVDFAQSTQTETTLGNYPDTLKYWNKTGDTLLYTEGLAINKEANPSLKGKAMLAQFDLGYQWNASSVVARFHYLQNDSTFRNPLAQSPTFLIERIYHVDGMQKESIFNAMVSPMDAIYYSVYNYTPNPKVIYDTTRVGLPSDGFASQLGTEPYHNSTYHKNAYTKSVHFRQNYVRMAGSGLQEVLGMGYATADRKGFGLNLDLNYKKALKFKSEFGQYKDHSDSSYKILGAGAHIVPMAFIDPIFDQLELDLAYQTQEGLYNKSVLMQLGGSWNFWDRVGLVGGYQTFGNTIKVLNPWYSDFAMGGELKAKHSQWLAGLEYEFSKQYYVLAAFGQSKVNVASVINPANNAGITQNIVNLKVRAGF